MNQLIVFLLMISLMPKPVAAQTVVLSSRVMKPMILKNSLKTKGNKYSFTFAKGKGVSIVRGMIIPLKVTHSGPVSVSSNKTPLTYHTYHDEACTKKCTINRPGTYYVKVSQSAYSIDLLDHHYAQFKKAGITFYVSQANGDDVKLKEKTYAVVSGRPKIKIHTHKGYLKLRSQKLNEKGKYVNGGKYTLYDQKMKRLGDISSDEKMATLKGDYELIPDGQGIYRLKYTLYNPPYAKNTSLQKARLLKKEFHGAFYAGDPDQQFFKVKLTSSAVIDFIIRNLRADHVFLLNAKNEKQSLQVTRDGQQTRYTSSKLDAGTYYIKIEKEVSNSGILYDLERVS